MKTSLPYNDNLYNSEEDNKQNTLFAGTLCLEARSPSSNKIPIMGMVSDIGFNTIKGNLVKSILYSKTNSFEFYSDSLRFVAVLGCLSVLGFLISLYSQIKAY